jgi:hypothetical protein
MAKEITLRQIAEDQGFDGVDELLEKFVFQSDVPACCSAGCMVEPDGKCPHGNVSILIKAGIV